MLPKRTTQSYFDLMLYMFCNNGNPITNMNGTPTDVEGEGASTKSDTKAPAASQSTLQIWGLKAWKMATHGLYVDIHDVVKNSATVGAIHESAEIYEPRVAYAFMYHQESRPTITHLYMTCGKNQPCG